MVYCGIYITARNYEISVTDADGKLLIDSIITDSQEVCEKLCSLFKRLKIEQSDIVIGIEASGYDQLSMYDYLTDQNFMVKIISPIQSDAFHKMDSFQTNTNIKNSFLIAQEIRFEQYAKTTVSNKNSDRLSTLLISKNKPYLSELQDSHSAYVRKATLADLPEVISLYKKVIQNMNENGLYQWDDIYPNEEILRNDIASDSLYLYLVDRQIASAFVLNQICDPEYAEGNWNYPLSSYAVVHRLCVNPVFHHMGIGTRTMLEVERLVKSMDIESIRLDAFSLNPAAQQLYKKLGYSQAGTVVFRVGLFYLFEKKL